MCAAEKRGGVLGYMMKQHDGGGGGAGEGELAVLALDRIGKRGKAN